MIMPKEFGAWIRESTLCEGHPVMRSGHVAGARIKLYNVKLCNVCPCGPNKEVRISPLIIHDGF